MSFLARWEGDFIVTGFFLISTSMGGQKEPLTLRSALGPNCSVGADEGHECDVLVIAGFPTATQLVHRPEGTCLETESATNQCYTFSPLMLGKIPGRDASASLGRSQAF